MTTPTVQAPQPGGHNPDGYMQMSHHYVSQSRVELGAGDLVQASEKASGAVATALKAIAQQRSWRHDSHALRQAVVSQLGAELGSPTAAAQVLYRGRAEADSQHQNYYENFLYEEDILYSIGIAETFVQAIEQLMNEPPKPFTVSKPLDRHRIAQLTGYEPDLGVTDAQGFANFDGVVMEE